jgi:hypothetical protein
VAAAVLHELAILAYALFFWRLRPTVPVEATAFTIHRRSQYAGLMGALLFVSVVEMVVLHVLLAPHHPGWALALEVVSVYSILWIVGDYQAIRLRPMVVGRDEVRVRVGLRRDVTIPVGDIAGVDPAPELDRGTPGYLRGTLLGLEQPVWLLRLTRPAVARVMLRAPREVTLIGVAPDDAEAFRRAVRLAAVAPPR